ncbi:MAG: bifunctional metallophosphatase/5'-nucleotidase [Candidatus Promineofilum sp.]|nr:bifunctional metallophosphatase/5'-nucleotidase [Promineifilum sp.]MBP9657089.1 bifunctional metallophosphatase/5'-nucleotidase [Promineifilum sp.]
MRKTRLFLFTVLIISLMAFGAAVQTGPAAAQGGVTLTLLHNSDGESALLSTIYDVPAGGYFGNTEDVELAVSGVASFKTLMDAQIHEAREGGNSVLTIYAGDAFLASSVLVCSLPPLNEPIYDAVAQRQMQYNAHVFGNHEFDFGPDFLEKFIRTFAIDDQLTQPFLSANLDFSGEPGYSDLTAEGGLIDGAVKDNRPIANSLIYVDPDTGEKFGIVSATTPLLPTISSPRNVTVLDLEETIVAVQAEVDRLESMGVNKIIFSSHLQDLQNDIDLLGELTGIDIAVGGGGDEILVNPAMPVEDQLLPGEEPDIFGDYPIQAEDKDGDPVYLVTTKGNYKYLGRLDVEFDDGGVVTSIVTDASYPRRNIPDTEENAEAIAALGVTDVSAPDGGILTTVIDPVLACTSGFKTTIIAYSEVVLDVSRNPNRSRETNGGNLISDAYLNAYKKLGEISGVMTMDENPAVAVQNGGGIRQNAGEFLTGEISRQNTLDVLPFNNSVVTIENMTPELLKETLEFSVAGSLPWGGFLQVSGMHVVYDLSRPSGDRILLLTVGDGIPIVVGGAVVEDAPLVNFTTIDFTAGGGDGYEMLADQPTIILSDGHAKISDERALALYLTGSEEDFPLGDNDLPTIQADDPRYQPGGEGRIVFVTNRVFFPALAR